MTNPAARVIPIPPEALDDAGIVLGRRGAGKSNALMCLFEHELDAGHRAVMIDPKGDRYGIRMDADGSPSRFTIPIFGGDHGDIPVDDTMGERIGRLVAEHDLSCLIDLSLMSLAGKQKFMLGFAPELLHHNRAALTLFIEEVDQFANQDPRYQPAMLVHHIANFSTLGRQRGIVPWVASQRPAKVNATVRSQADTFVGMKVTSPLDREAYREWFKGHGKEAAARVEEEVGRLQPGEALVWVGASEFFDKVRFPMAGTFDSGRTPKHGETIAHVTLEPIDLGEIRAALAPTESAKNIAGNIPGGAPDYAETMQLLAAIESERDDLAAQVEELTVARDEWKAKAELFDAQITAAIRALGVKPIDEIADEIEDRRWAEGLKAATPSQRRNEGRQSPPSPPASPERPRRDNAGVTAGETALDPKLGPERRPLATLAGVYPSGLTEAQWATAAGFKRSGTWGTYKSRLRGADLIEQRGDRWFATEIGASAVGEIETPPAPGPELVRWWVGKLQAVGPMAEALIAQWPEWTERETLAGYLGMSPTSGTFSTYLSRLAGPGLIERDRERGVRLSAEVMGQ